MAGFMIAIVVLNWNGKQDTLTCLASLAQLNAEVIVVDNGSTDGSADAFRTQFPQYHLIENGENYGFAEGNNVGIRFAMHRGADMIMLLNNDTVVAPDILDHFVAQFAAAPEVGILGANICLFGQRETLDHLGGMWNPKTATFTFVGKNEPATQWQESQELDYVCGAGIIIRRAVIEAIGLLDPRFFLIWEESDYCFRARRAGFKVATCPKARIWHKVSASFTSKPHSTYFWWRNRLLWIEKNCSFREKTSLYLRILIPEAIHKLKIHAILFIKRKKEKLIQNRAALCGMRDYALRRFGKGSWK
jgi:GT2 family glycosyltransferase